MTVPKPSQNFDGSAERNRDIFKAMIIPSLNEDVILVTMRTKVTKLYLRLNLTKLQPETCHIKKQKVQTNVVQLIGKSDQKTLQQQLARCFSCPSSTGGWQRVRHSFKNFRHATVCQKTHESL